MSTGNYQAQSETIYLISISEPGSLSDNFFFTRSELWDWAHNADELPPAIYADLMRAAPEGQIPFGINPSVSSDQELLESARADRAPDRSKMTRFT